MTAVAVTAVLVALWCQDPKANFDFDMAAALLWVLMGGWMHSLGWISRVGLQGAWPRCPRERHFAVLAFAVLEKNNANKKYFCP